MLSNSPTKPAFASRKRILARLGEMETERSPHITDWRNITNFIRPNRGRYLYDSQEQSARPTSLVNSTPAEASRTLQAGMVSGASSPAYQWFMFEYDDPQLKDWGPAREHLEVRQQIVYSLLANSNFYQSLQTLYGDSADFGTGMGLLMSHPRDTLTLAPLSPGEYFIDTDFAGDINTIYLKRKMTVLQMIGRFKKENCPEEVRRAYDETRYQQTFTIIEAIEENQDYDEGKGDWRGKPYVWFCLCLEQKDGEDGVDGMLDVSGYNEWPAPNLRWDVASGNKWGTGPGLLALGDSKALQSYEFRSAQAVDKAVTPPMRAPVSLRNKPLSHAPGGITYVDAYMAGNPIDAIYTISPGVLQAISAKIQEKEFRINAIYYKDLFLMLSTSDRREITAREVEEKHQEKLLALGPVVQRTHRDALDNAIIRVYQMAYRAGLFPDPPNELKESMVKVSYTSALAFAQRAAGAAALERFFGFMGQGVQVFPNWRHKVKDLEVLNQYADAIGVPAKVMRSDEDAEAAAAAEQQQMAAAQAPEAANQMAGAAKLLSETDTSRPSALSFLQQRMGL